MNIIFYGPPGAGKGTQAHLLATRKKFFHLSTGDLLRKSLSTSHQLGQEAQKFMKKGELVPNKIVIGLIHEQIKHSRRDSSPLSGFIFDGFPRNMAQAESLKEILKMENEVLHKLILIRVQKRELIRRLAGRRVCETCQRVFHIVENSDLCPHCETVLKKRKDDTAGAIEKRLEIYEESTTSLIEFYTPQVAVHEVRGEGSVEEIYSRIQEVLAL